MKIQADGLIFQNLLFSNIALKSDLLQITTSGITLNIIDCAFRNITANYIISGTENQSFANMVGLTSYEVFANCFIHFASTKLTIDDIQSDPTCGDLEEIAF